MFMQHGLNNTMNIKNAVKRKKTSEADLITRLE